MVTVFVARSARDTAVDHSGSAGNRKTVGAIAEIDGFAAGVANRWSPN